MPIAPPHDLLPRCASVHPPKKTCVRRHAVLVVRGDVVTAGVSMPPVSRFCKRSSMDSLYVGLSGGLAVLDHRLDVCETILDLRLRLRVHDQSLEPLRFNPTPTMALSVWMSIILNPLRLHLLVGHELLFLHHVLHVRVVVGHVVRIYLDIADAAVVTLQVCC